MQPASATPRCPSLITPIALQIRQRKSYPASPDHFVPLKMRRRVISDLIRGPKPEARAVGVSDSMLLSGASHYLYWLLRVTQVYNPCRFRERRT
jgi:hypothetical protein